MDATGRIWIGATSGELFVLDLVDGLVALVHGVPGSGWEEKDITDIYQDQFGDLWFGTRGREQLFDLGKDQHELTNLTDFETEQCNPLRALAIAACDLPGACDVLTETGLASFPYEDRKRQRVY